MHHHRNVRFIPFLFLLLGFQFFGMFSDPHYSFAEGTYTGIGTSAGQDGSNDAINFSQGRVWTIDQYGKYIWLTEKRSNGSHYWAWSNDVGASWTESSETYGFLTRGSVAYDSINDRLHVIWTADAASDGIIYRRYSITRDGSNNISSIQRVDTNVNLQLDTTSSRTLEQPVALWVDDGSADGILLAFWSKRDSGINEARGSMRRLSMTDADGTAGNWLALDGSADTFATDAPAVAADKIYTDGSGSNAVGVKIRGGSGSHKDDLYVFVAEEDDSTADEVLAYRATWSSGSLNWSGGWTALGTIGSMGTGSGYSLKYQLITKPVIDTTNDRLYIGWARWKDGTNGDTVSMAYLDSTDTVSSTIDLYSALGTHSYAPTLDLAYDSTMDQLYAAYILSTTNGDNGSIDYKTYAGSTLSSSTRFYTTPGGSGGADGSADIPILYESRSNGRLLFAFRINGALPPTALDPHTIDWGYITLPTPTPTPVPAATSSTDSAPSLPVPQAPVCSALPPGVPAPKLYGHEASFSSIKLYFTESGQPFDGYVFSYGYTSGDDRFGTTIPASSGLRTTSIHALAPNTTYYFRMRASNSCATGPWSNTYLVKTKALTNPILEASVRRVPLAPSILSPIRPVGTSTLELQAERTSLPDAAEPTPTPLVSKELVDLETQTQATRRLILGVVVVIVLIASGVFVFLRMR